MRSEMRANGVGDFAMIEESKTKCTAIYKFKVYLKINNIILN